VEEKVRMEEKGREGARGRVKEGRKPEETDRERERARMVERGMVEE
jgi:hypothetical protein